MRTARLLLVLSPLVASSVLAGCGGNDQPSASPRTTLAAAKRNLDRTTGVRIGLSTPRLPSGVSGLLSAQGVGTHAPAFEGTIKVAAAGITADATVVALHGRVLAKLPFSTRFVSIDPADYGAPDPAELMSSQGGLSSLLTSAEHVKAAKQVRQGKVVLHSYTGSVPGRAVAAVLPSAAAKAGFDATFTVTDQQRLTKAVLTGPFYPRAGDVTYTITFDDYGIRKHISAP
jgi:lipoprotein LprG